jgi:hypothetical protein
MMKFDPEADYPYPDDELARAALDRLRSRRRVVDSSLSVASRLRREPYDDETEAVRSAFDAIWYNATEVYNIQAGPETWTFHSSRLWAFPDEEITGWHDLPTLDLASMDGWNRMWLPKVLSPGTLYSCTRCTFETYREDRARVHDRDDHPEERVGPSQPLTHSSHFDAVDEEDESRSTSEYSGEGQYSLVDFGGES